MYFFYFLILYTLNKLYKYLHNHVSYGLVLVS